MGGRRRGQGKCRRDPRGLTRWACFSALPRAGASLTDRERFAPALGRSPWCRRGLRRASTPRLYGPRSPPTVGADITRSYATFSLSQAPIQLVVGLAGVRAVPATPTARRHNWSYMTPPGVLLAGPRAAEYSSGRAGCAGCRATRSSGATTSQPNATNTPETGPEKLLEEKGSPPPAANTLIRSGALERDPPRTWPRR